AGVRVTPVWNKSNREHAFIGTHPEDTRRAAQEAVKKAGWAGQFFVDADHVGIATVDRFIGSSNYFTIDVAEQIGSAPNENAVESFLQKMRRFRGPLEVPGMAGPITVSEGLLRSIAQRYLNCIGEAGRVYRLLLSKMSADGFVTEISLDESDLPQSPAELFFILGGLALQEIPVNAVAPKFSGLFLKGIDYVGDTNVFAREFEQDLAVLALARKSFRLPEGLKLSIHTGSDKFSLYPLMHQALVRQSSGIHLKTAGTTWIEEVIGLAESGGEGLTFAKALYAQAYRRIGELCTPYRHVIRIDPSTLPAPADVESWGPEIFSRALCHEPRDPMFNPHFRQLIHVAYKVAAESGPIFLQLLRKNAEAIGRHVTHNLLHRHIMPLFLGTSEPD
ncbi:MAG TPA: tagaturonate epimerase family protein, partial [Bacteroidota bacterium]|nr:tagaturonate epimerase family protein [Bacteroidota bacterium]